MKYLRQFFIIILISFIGEVLNYLIPLPVPASIYGMVIMFTLLITKRLKVESVKEVSTFLIKLFPVMFIPPAVGIMDSLESISSKIFIYIGVAVVSTVIVMGVTGLITQLIIKKGK